MSGPVPKTNGHGDGLQDTVPRPGTNLGLTFKVLVLLFVLALACRAGYGVFGMWPSGDPAALIFPDEQQYWSMSRELRGGGLLTDEMGFHATRMPLYPGLLALFPTSSAGVLGAKMCQWVLGALAAPLAALLGARALGATVGLVTGLMVAVDPSLVGLSSLLLTEAPFVTALTALWLVSWPLLDGERQRPGGGRPLCWLGVGLLSALCVYLRPSSAGLVPVWTAVLMVRQGLPNARTWAGGAIVAGTLAVSLCPWAARNQRVTGHWCWLTHRGGISLYDGVGPQATGAGDLGQIKNMPAVAGLDEVAWDRWFRTRSWESIRSDPLRIIRLAGVKLARTWSPILHAREYGSTGIRIVFAAWSIPLFALAVAAVVMLPRRPITVFALLVPALYLSALHSVFVGSVRYRAGAVPGLAVLAAYALVTMVRAAAARRRESRP